MTNAAITLGAVAPTIIHAEKAEAYLREQIGTSKKALKEKSFFDYKSLIEFNGTDTNLQFLGRYKIILKEDAENFYFNIIQEAFVNPNIENKHLIAELEEEYIADLLKAKKTLERQFKGKKFFPELRIQSPGKASGDNEVDGISGATLSCNALEVMLNSESKKYIPAIKESLKQ